MTKIGHYEIIGTLGSGGMSQVFLARSDPTGALVVIKKQHDDRDDDSLMDEARVGLRLNHPHIVETLDLLHHDGRPLLVTAYVSGVSLADLRVQGPLPPDLVLTLGRDIASALSFVHEAKEEDGTPLEIIHRDVTPANIIIGHDGIPRLIDLGIARSSVSQRDRTQTGFLRGTLRYLAPEILQGSPYSPVTDLWGLGATLWESALGRYTVEGNDPQVFAQILKGEVFGLRPTDVVDPRVRDAVGALLRVDPSTRPQTARAAVDVFDTYIHPDHDAGLLAASVVNRASGPTSHYDDDIGMERAQLLVNRAAANFGGPLGDWRISSDVAARLTSRRRRADLEHVDADAADGFVDEKTIELSAFNEARAKAAAGPGGVDNAVAERGTPSDATEIIDSARFKRQSATARVVDDDIRDLPQRPAPTAAPSRPTPPSPSPKVTPPAPLAAPSRPAPPPPKAAHTAAPTASTTAAPSASTTAAPSASTTAAPTASTTAAPTAAPPRPATSSSKPTPTAPLTTSPSPRSAASSSRAANRITVVPERPVAASSKAPSVLAGGASDAPPGFKERSSVAAESHTLTVAPTVAPMRGGTIAPVSAPLRTPPGAAHRGFGTDVPAPLDFPSLDSRVEITDDEIGSFEGGNLTPVPQAPMAPLRPTSQASAIGGKPAEFTTDDVPSTRGPLRAPEAMAARETTVSPPPDFVFPSFGSASGGAVPVEAPFAEEELLTGDIVDVYQLEEHESFAVGEPTEEFKPTSPLDVNGVANPSPQMTEVHDIDRARVRTSSKRATFIVEDEDPKRPDWLPAHTLTDAGEQSVTDPTQLKRPRSKETG